MIVLMRNETLIGVYSSPEAVMTAMVHDMEINQVRDGYSIETLNI